MSMGSTKSTVQEIPVSQVLSLRQWVYRFFGRFFYKEPNLGELLVLGESNPFQILAEDEESQGEGLQLLVDFLAEVPALSKEECKNLKEEYQRLFLGPDPLPAHPWESVYLSREHIILDEHTLKVREFYRAWGVEVDGNDPDDHIGLELEFMALLNEKGLDCCNLGNLSGLKDVLTAQRAFLENHLLCWTQKYCNLLAQSTAHPLYRGIALFTPEYLEADRDLLDELLSSL